MATHGTQLRYPCDVCGRIFSNWFSLTQHSKRHLEQRPFSCDFSACSYSGKTDSDLQEHKKKVHATSANACPYCGKEIKYLHNFKAHVAKHEAAGTPGLIKCLHFRCKRTFSNTQDLRSHVLSHRSDVETHEIFSVSRPFACDAPGCSYAAKFKSGLNNHKHKMHSAGLFASDLCDKQFKNKLYLRLHIERHLKNAANPRLTCSSSQASLKDEPEDEIIVD